MLGFEFSLLRPPRVILIPKPPAQSTVVRKAPCVRAQVKRYYRRVCQGRDEVTFVFLTHVS